MPEAALFSRRKWNGDFSSRGSLPDSPFNQNVVTRSAASREKTDFFAFSKT
jgi:hypothetical protein